MSHPGTTRPRSLSRGFTMIEMLIVVALVGLVATLAMPSFRHSTVKAREAVLKENLWIMRDVIDQFYTDKGRYPTSLDELVSSGYLRRIPYDPVAETSEWELSFEPLSDDASEGPEGLDPGITDVHSTATGQAMDGVSYYSDW